MLKYNYSLSTSSNYQEIVLDDFYVSPDLSFVSGTTDNIRICSAGDNLWVHSPYFPNELPVKVTSSELVKRNGYILIPKTLQVHNAKTYNSDNTSIPVKYVEYNGNTYFSDINTGDFTVNGEIYTPTSGFLTIYDKIYIENDKLTVNGITFNVTINNGSELFLTNSVGKMHLVPVEWVVSGVDVNPKWVTKLSIGENTNNPIDCRWIGYYGHRSYITYNGEKKYLEYFYDVNGNITGAGVTIDGVEYPCDALYVMHDYDWDEWFNLYNINDYYKNEYDNAVMDIGGNNYIIGFEAGGIQNSGIIGIETVEENLPILCGDRLTIHSTNESSEVIVRYDGEGQGYIYLNGRRYNTVKNLCDCVMIGGVFRELICDGNCENPYIGMIVSCNTSDDSVMHFMVASISDGKIGSMKKVEYVNGEWKDIYSMVQVEGGGVTYSASTDYLIAHYDGIRIGDYNAKVLHYENVSHEGEESETLQEYDYIVVGSMLEYRLKVINTVGSNVFLCIPDVDITVYDGVSMDDIVTEILYSIQGNNFVVERRKDTFGVTDLYYDTWMSEAAQNIESISVYELADVENNIRIIRKSSHFTIPVGLYRNISQKLEYDTLITTQYYEEEAEKAINKIVDMDKDMYTPVKKVTTDNVDTFFNIDSIEFNLHFRTRDLETWKIIEDEGLYDNGDDGQALSANYQYCNWFVTDYYPFNKIIYDHTEKFGELSSMSDLLGLMYFTTNDVETKMDKLKRSFLRLTFFDSKNPEKQNMLGTSTMYFDCERYLDTLNKRHDGIHFEQVAKSQIPNRFPGNNTNTIDMMPREENSPNVLTEAFEIPQDGYGYPNTGDLCTSDYNLTLNSKIIVQDRYSGNNSSEGFYSYILKEFANKKAPQTIYMKAEFFHAGVGVKIPMVLASDDNKNAIAKNGWNNNVLGKFKMGYDLDSVFDRLYIPIVIEYSTKLRQFVYHISEDNNYLNAVLDDNKWVFNLFELKIKT